MDALIGLLMAGLKEATASQPVLQVFVCGFLMLLITFMVMRGMRDRSLPGVPAPAPGTVTDPLPALPHVLREVVDLLREIRDLARRGVEEADRIADDVRAIRDDGRRRNEILDRIDREMTAENRAHRRDHG